jgi:hypothetical protein
MAESLRCDGIDAMGVSHKLTEYSTVEVLPNQAFSLRRLNAEMRDVGVLNNQRWRGPDSLEPSSAGAAQGEPER